MTCEVRVIADSISEEGARITTFQLKYWRAIHAEFMTHRVFSRNASSSRAIPVAKMIEQVRNDPAGPIHFGQNRAGMQADAEIQDPKAAQELWLEASRNAADMAERMARLGLHKQVVNRILEPFQWIHVVATSTEFDNFFDLRCHPDAQPEMQELAYAIHHAREASTPLLRPCSGGLNQSWHLPYITEGERGINLLDALKISAARCCRVSYLKHDGSCSSIREDLDLCARLIGSTPIHASPFEHQAAPDRKLPDGRWECPELHGNLVGWKQYRKLIEPRADGC